MKIFFFAKKNPILLVLPIEEISSDQSSPVQPVSESREGTLRVTEKDEVQTEDGNPHVSFRILYVMYLLRYSNVLHFLPNNLILFLQIRFNLFSRPGQSHGLLFKQSHDSLSQSSFSYYSFTAPPRPNG